MKDLLEAINLFESASPENPVSLVISNGRESLDVTVTDATVDVTFSDGISKGDEAIDVSIDYTYGALE